MASIEQAILLGIIQGITEWLPISSSAHLALAQMLFGLETDIALDLALHIGTLAAVLIYFRNDIIALFKDTLLCRPEQCNYALAIFASLIPTAIIGFAFKDFFESMFASLWHLAAALLVTGALLLSTTLVKFGTRTPTLRDSLLIGIAQGIAVAPGISRSGSTIATALFLGIKPIEAARFSFLISILPVLGAGILEVGGALSAQADPLPLAVGTLASAVVGYLSIGALLSLMRTTGIHIFGYYCIALAAALCALIYIGL
ncbi:MAG: undecaprenyl-diphosphate phosphatase [Candidatus Micrarchaeia archaeon]